MMKTRLAIATLVIAGLAGSPFAVAAKTYKHTKHQTSSSTTTGSKTTTGSNMKPSGGTSGMSGSTSSQGKAAPGTNKY